MLTLIDALRRTVLVNGDRNATVYKDRTQTWKELAGRVARLANALQKRGCGRGSRMANLALNSDRYYEYYFVPGWLGGVFVPINIRLALPEVIFWLSDSESEVLFIDDSFLPMLPEIKKQAPAIQSSWGRPLIKY